MEKVWFLRYKLKISRKKYLFLDIISEFGEKKVWLARYTIWIVRFKLRIMRKLIVRYKFRKQKKSVLQDINSMEHNGKSLNCEINLFLFRCGYKLPYFVHFHLKQMTLVSICVAMPFKHWVLKCNWRSVYSDSILCLKDTDCWSSRNINVVRM